MATIGSLLVNLAMNTAGFNESIKKTDKRLKRFSRKTKKSIKKIAKAFDGVGKSVGVLGVVAGATTLKLISMGSDFEETASKFGTVFAGMEDKANGFKDVLSESFGTSKRESMLFLSSIQDLLVPMGVAADKAADLSFETVKLASDIGSFNNQPTAKVMDDISSALTGSFETMKKYGVVLNETVIKQRALEEGIGDSTGKVNAAQKAQLALKIITESSSAAVGDFARTSDGFANSLKIVKSKIEDAANKLGKDFLPSAKDVLLIVKDIIPEMMFLAKVVGTVLVDAFKFWIPLVKDGIGFLRDYNKESNETTIETNNLAGALLRGEISWKGFQSAQKNAAVQGKKNAVIINKNIGAIEKLKQSTDRTKSSGEKLEKTYKKTWNSFADGAKFAADTTNDQFSIMAQAGRDFTSGIRSELANTFEDALKGNLKSAESLFTSFGGVVISVIANIAAEWVVAQVAASGFATAVQAAWASVLGPIVLVIAAIALLANNWEAVNDAITKFFSGIERFVRGFFEIINAVIVELGKFISGGKGFWEKRLGIDIPFVAFADGGISSGFNPGIVSTPTFNAGGTAVAGESGKEAIIPLKGGAVPVELSGGGGGGNTITLILKAGDDLMSVIASSLEVMSEDGRVKIDRSALTDRAQI